MSNEELIDVYFELQRQRYLAKGCSPERAAENAAIETRWLMQAMEVRSRTRAGLYQFTAYKTDFTCESPR